MELKGRRELFCREYLKDLNATQAAIRAGYSQDRARQTGCELLAEQEIQERIAALAEGRNKKLELDANLIIIELLRMLTADPLNYVDEAGVVKSLHDMTIDARRAISSFEVDTIGSANTVTRTKVKFWSKEKAAELLGKHLTLFKEVLTVEGLDDLAKRIVEARNRDAASAESLV
jgi:phage terminase small subunit